MMETRYIPPAYLSVEHNSIKVNSNHFQFRAGNEQNDFTLRFISCLCRFDSVCLLTKCRRRRRTFILDNARKGEKVDTFQ